MKCTTLIVALSISACGDNIAMGIPDELPGTSITLTVKDRPLLVMYRDAAEQEWKQADAIDSTTYQLSARGPYVLTLVCQTSDHYIWIQQIAQTPEDGDIPAQCEYDAGPHRLTGRILQNAWVCVYHYCIDYSVWSSEHNPFEFWLPAGTYDVIAYGAGRIAMRRKIRIAADTMVSNPIDLMIEGTSLVPTVLSVSNPLPPERYWAEVKLDTQFGFYWDGPADIDKVPLVPNSVLEPADVQYITVQASSPLGGRHVRRRVHEGDSTVFTLPERMGPVTFAQAGKTLMATWSTLPEHDRILHSAGGHSVDPSLFVDYSATVSRGFEAIAGATSVTFETEIPGYLPEWRLDLTKEYWHWLEVEQQVGSDTLGASQGVTVNEAPPEEGRRLPARATPFLRSRHRDLP